MVTTKLNLSMTEPSARQIYAKQGDTGRVLDITLDQTPEDGTLRILRPDGVEVTSEAVTGGEVSESGETVSFESLTEADVTGLTVGIEPVQDLNGFDKPWVGGAGKNLLNNTASSSSPSGITFTVNADGTVTATGTATADAQFQILFSGLSGNYYFCGCPSGGNASTKYDVYAWDLTASARFKKWNGTTNSASDIGTYSLQEIQIPSGHSGYIVIRIKSGYAIQGSLVFKPMIVASSVTDNSYAPYSNICPISGWTGANVYRTGINIWDEVWEVGAIVNGHNYPANNNIRSKNYIACCGDTQYRFSTTVNIVLFQYDKNKNLIFPSSLPYIQIYKTSPAFTTLANTRYIRFYTNENSYGIEYKNDISINYPSTDTAYHPDTSNVTIPISWQSVAGTVYGGTIDVATGLLTVDRASVDLGTLGWNEHSRNLFYTYGFTAKPVSASNVVPNLICSEYKTLSGDEVYMRNDGISMWSTSGNVAIYDSDKTGLTANQFKTAMSGVQLVYKLATPQTYQLSGQQLMTLLGTNNVWASSGDIVSIKFTYGGLLSELPSDATSIVGKCYCDIEQNGVSSMPFTLNVKKNERAT